MEISILIKKKCFINFQSKSNNWCIFHSDLCPESLLNGQLKMLGMVQETVLRHQKVRYRGRKSKQMMHRSKVSVKF